MQLYVALKTEQIHDPNGLFLGTDYAKSLRYEGGVPLWNISKQLQPEVSHKEDSPTSPMPKTTVYETYNSTERERF